MPQPGGNQTPYGQASQFNPQYSSFLPQDQMASAQLGDPTYQQYGAPTPLLQQQQAAPIAAPQQGPDMNSLRTMLASLAKVNAAGQRQDQKHNNMWRGGR